MDAKITKKRLGDFLSYEWLKIVAIAVALIVAWSILFSCTSAQLTHDQVFTIINYTGTSTGSGFYDYTSTLKSKGVFSYEINEVSTLDITVENGSMSGTLLETRLTTGQGDVMFVADADWVGEEYYVTDDDGNKIDDGEGDYEKATSTYLRSFLHSSYHYTVVPLTDLTEIKMPDGYAYPYETKGVLTYVREYLDDYFTLDGDEFVADEQFDDGDWAEMESRFRARVSSTQDKRFRNESLIQSGLQQEKERLIKYRDAYNTFMDNMTTGKIQPTSSKVVFEDGENKLVSTGEYSLNICPSDVNMSTLKQTVGYDSKGVYTAQNMNIVFLNVGDSQPEFFCEKILFVNYLIDTHYVESSTNP